MRATEAVNVRFGAANLDPRLTAPGRQRQLQPLTSRHSTGLQRRMASVAIESPS